MEKTALWVDDIRPAPVGYYWAKSVHEAKIYCCQHLSPGHILKIDEFNLDQKQKATQWRKQKKIFLSN